KCKIMLLDDYSPDTDTGECYRKDGQDDLPKVITKAEFDRLKNEFEGDGQTVELDWKPLAEYGR
ncbi:MAG: hypothetical protein FWC27_03210, partial [Firmicutes bacterium]|nr:hypothetical protein [Bacillota bacterium]